MDVGQAVLIKLDDARYPTPAHVVKVVTREPTGIERAYGIDPTRYEVITDRSGVWFSVAANKIAERE